MTVTLRGSRRSGIGRLTDCPYGFPALSTGADTAPRWRDPDSNRGHHDFQSAAFGA